MTADSQQDMLTDIFEAQRRSLVGSIYRVVGSVQTAEELAQDAYLRVSAAIARGPIDHIQTFLFRTARNLAIDHVRREKLRRTFLVDDTETTGVAAVADPAPDQERAVIDTENLRLVAVALKDLPERKRTALVLSRLHKVPYPEIARRLGVSEATVYNDIRSAIRHCVTVLKNGEGDA